MIFSAAQVALFGALAVFGMLAGGYHLYRSLQARERLIARAEDLAADPSVLSDPLRRKSFLVRWADRYDRTPPAIRDRERLRRACLPLKPSDYRVLRLAVAAALGYICMMMLQASPLLAVGAGLAVYFFGPRILFTLRRDAYVKQFNDQLVEVAQSMANALRAGMSVQQGLGQVPERVSEPASGEFRQTHHELLLGDNLALALAGLRKRVGSRDLDVLVNAVVVQHQAGGNLARVLNAMANILAERQRLASEIRSMTAEVRFSAAIIQIMPLGLLIIVRSTPFGEALFNNVIGWVLLAIYVVAQIGIFFLIRRILRIEV